MIRQIVDLRDRVLNWEGYVVACVSCGRTEGLQLVVMSNPDWWSGEQAEVHCPSCSERFRNPLVYPQLVHAIAEWKRAGEAQDLYSEVLPTLPWAPHQEDVDGDSHGDGTFMSYQYSMWSDSMLVLDKIMYDNSTRRAFPDLVELWERAIRRPTTRRDDDL